MKHFTCTIDSIPLSTLETIALNGSVSLYGADEHIWEVYKSIFISSSDTVQPVIVRIRDGQHLAGAAIMIRCTRFGESLFSHPLLRFITNQIQVPIYFWIRVGMCAETISNPGFVATGYNYGKVMNCLMNFLHCHTPLTVIIDNASERLLHKNAKSFTFVQDSFIDLETIPMIETYEKNFKNLIHQIKKFNAKGGTIEFLHGKLSTEIITTMQELLQSTTEKSIVISPFQEAFPTLLSLVADISSQRITHIIARVNQKIIGYQTFLQSGTGLHLIFGAFDRTQKTTFHAYETILYHAVNYCIKKGLRFIHLGLVFNNTKRRMSNSFSKTSIYCYSKTALIRNALPLVFPRTRWQDSILLKQGNSIEHV